MIKLLELRTCEGLTQRDVAKALFVSQGTYNNWENGKTEPAIGQLIALSQFFGESIDYIVGNSIDGKRVNRFTKFSKDEMIKAIEAMETELNNFKERLLDE